MNITPSTKDLVFLTTTSCMQDAISQQTTFDQWVIFEKFLTSRKWSNLFMFS